MTSHAIPEHNPTINADDNFCDTGVEYTDYIASQRGEVVILMGCLYYVTAVFVILGVASIGAAMFMVIVWRAAWWLAGKVIDA